ncbi:MAG: trehalose-6-phosphate synthase [Candidatus Bathyarchaeota archaeon]|nr:trehalose-6-phosphate synthase [Candidatus Bathyarchaeota archaeon]
MSDITKIKSLLGGRRLVLVSNREPYTHKKRTDGNIMCVRGSGGLVAALDPMMQSTGGLWVAWGSGNVDFTVSDDRGRVKVPPEKPSYTLRRVRLSSRDVTQYYYGFSNRVMWPVFCLFLDKAHFAAHFWRSYRRVNEKFARAITEEAKADDLIWVHDYHLSLVPRLIRDLAEDAKIAFFWHIPWPPLEAFLTIPWKREILEGLLGSDLIGLQTQRHAKNFIECAEKELNASFDGRVLKTGNREVVVKAIPIGVDYRELAAHSRKMVKRASKLRRRLSVEHLILGVDRLDYTKGILDKLCAFERFLERNPVFQGKVSLVQLAAPSRTRIPEYREMKSKVDEMVARINGRFQTTTWVPVRYFYRQIPYERLIAYYKAADVTLVTSLADGMNLVAKEYVAAKVNGDGVLILSQFTGAAEELSEAIIVNPYNVEGLAEAIKEALETPHAQRKQRMNRLQEKVKKHDIYWWLESFLSELRGTYN